MNKKNKITICLLILISMMFIVDTHIASHIILFILGTIMLFVSIILFVIALILAVISIILITFSNISEAMMDYINKFLL